VPTPTMPDQIRLKVKKPLMPASLYSPTIAMPALFPPTSLVSINNIIYAHNALPTSNRVIEMNSAQRENHNVAIDGEVTAKEFTGKLMDITLVKIKLLPVRAGDKTVGRKEMTERFISLYNNYPLSLGQLFYMKYEDDPIKAEVCEVMLEDGEAREDAVNVCGMVSYKTTVHFFSESAHLAIDQPSDENMLLKTNFNFFSLGIGGLKEEFATMFRRAFLSRVYKKDLMDRLHIDHVKGIMLYGPPGTGKTLIARQIGRLLNAREPKIVNGPEVLNKYVGQSEENIRELFKDAEKEWRKKGSASHLHIIIFDEIDAVCKKRSENSSITDQVVNQLLSKMDGVESLNNILVIGMTNRMDLIDPALLRPGRFEIHVEIGLPNLEDRKEILEIHTAALKKNNVLDGVSLEEVAKQTNNYTGAELTAVVKSAVSYALERGLKRKTGSAGDDADSGIDEGSSDAGSENGGDNYCTGSAAGRQGASGESSPNTIRVSDNIRVTMEDFLKAIDEVKPAFGLNEQEFTIFKKNYYSLRHHADIMQQIKEKIAYLLKTTFYNTSNILLCGESGVGKTTLSVRAALSMKIPYVKLISPREVIGYSEVEKIQFIKEIFINGYKCKQCLIIIDDIESLIDYVPLGPRFSNAVLQTIKTFVRMESNGKCFVIATCSSLEIMEELSLRESFDSLVVVRKISGNDIEELKEQNEAFGRVECGEIGIRELLGMLDICDLATE
ncbi:AAA+-type ATPase, partial [Trachipleistophora hominis]